MIALETAADRWLVRMEKGESAMAALKQFAVEHGIAAGMVRGIGAAMDARLGYYLLDEKRYEEFTVDEVVEVLSLLGNISLRDDGETIVHVHATLGRRGGEAVGGHLFELTAGATLELDVERLTGRTLVRAMDEGIGLPLLARCEKSGG